MDFEVMENIKKSCISYFNISRKAEIELLFDNITVILWELSDNGKINFVYDNKETVYSNMLKKYLRENWNEIISDGLNGFSLPNAKESVVFANGKSDVMIAVLMHEILHQLLGKKLNTMSILEHDFLVELIIEYVTCDILTIYNRTQNQENRQHSTYLSLDEVMNFPIKTLYQQLKNLIQNDATEINEIVGTEDRVAISVYYQDLLDKVLSCNKEESFKEQYADHIAEYSIEIRKIGENIIKNLKNYKDKNELSER